MLLLLCQEPLLCQHTVMTLLKDATLIQTECIIHIHETIQTFRRKEQSIWQHLYNSRAQLHREAHTLYWQRERALHRRHEQIKRSLCTPFYLLLFRCKCFPTISTQQAGECHGMSSRTLCRQESCGYLLVRNKKQNFSWHRSLVQ